MSYGCCELVETYKGFSIFEFRSLMNGTRFGAGLGIFTSLSSAKAAIDRWTKGEPR